MFERSRLFREQFREWEQIINLSRHMLTKLSRFELDGSACPHTISRFQVYGSFTVCDIFQTVQSVQYLLCTSCYWDLRCETYPAGFWARGLKRSKKCIVFTICSALFELPPSYPNLLLPWVGSMPG
jgi:hypothetical protein